MRKPLVLTIVFVFACGITLSSIMAFAQEDYNIPAWIKNNAAWWSEGQIDDASFVSGIKYMIENGIMKISQSNTPVNNMSLDDLYQENQEFREYFENTLSDTVEYARNEQVLSKENQKLDSLLAEYQDANDGFAKNEKVLQAEINSLKKQLATSSQGTTAADATTIEVMAQTNPLIRSIIDGKINFYVEPIPYYAADGVKEKVKSLTDWMDSTPTWNQVYNDASADLYIGWIKDYGHKALGITYSKNTIEVGLGTQTCTGDWAPFNDNTVYHVLWHEVGHSMGYGHSDDQNNIMYYSSPQQFYPDFEKNIFLADGVYQQLAFCKGGSYAYTITTDSQYSGFVANVLPPEQDPKEFTADGGLHYPDCATESTMTKFYQECNVGGDGVNNFSKLLIHNDRNSGTPGEAINIDVKIIDLSPFWLPELAWDEKAFQYDQEFLDLVASFQK